MKKQIFFLIALFAFISTGYAQDLRKVELVNEQTVVQFEQQVVKAEPKKLTDASVKVAEKAKLSKEDVLKRRMERASTKPVLQHSTSSRNIIFFDDFEENDDFVSPPLGWTEDCGPLSFPWLVYSGFAYNGFRGMGIPWDMEEDKDAWVFSPGFTLTAGNTYKVQFWAYMGYTEYDGDGLDVYIGQTPTSTAMPSAHVIFSDDNYYTQGDWELISEFFTPTTTGTYYLGFYGYTEVWGGDDICIDDVEVINLTPSEGIDGEVAQIITPSSGLNLTSTEEVKVLIKNNSDEPLTGFDLQLELDGELIATETYSSSIASMGQAEYIFIATLDLSDEGTYEITVTAIIDDDIDESNNSATKIVVNTICSIIDTFPYDEGFENNSTNLPFCWTQEFVSTHRDWTWVIATNNGSYPSSPHGGTYLARFVNSSSTNPDITKLITPPIDLTGNTAPMLKFWHQQTDWSGDQDELRIYYKNSAGGEWTLLEAFTASEPAWTERMISLANPSNDYYIAFEGTAKYGRGIALDDIRIFDSSDLSAEIEINPVAMGTIYNNLPFPAVKTHQIRNVGGAPLEVTNIVSSSPEISVTGLPLEIAPFVTENITVTVNSNGLPVGEYSGNFVVASNDPNNPQKTVDVTGNVLAAIILDPLREDWTATTQPGWIYNLGGASFSRQATGGINNSPYIRANIYGTTTNFAIMQTPFVVMGDNPAISFAFRATNYSGGTAAAATTLSYSVSVTADGGVTWNTIYSIPVGEHIESAEFRLISVDVSEYADELCMFRITCNRHEGDINVSIDDVFIGTAPDYPIIEVLPVAMGVLYNNLPYPVSKIHQVKNTGGETLEVTNIVSSSPEITVTGLPFEIEPLEAEDITITVDGNGLETGAWTGNFVIASNDPNYPQKTVEVTGTIQEAVILNPLDENWNVGAPLGWVYNAGSSTFSRQTAGGVNNSPFIRANIFGTTSIMAIAQTPYVEMGDAPEMSFAFRAYNFSAPQGPAEASTLSYSVAVTNNNGVTWNTIHTVAVDEHIESEDFQTITVDVSDYADELCIFRIICNRHDGDIYVAIDDVRIGTFPVYEYCEPVTNFEVVYNDNCDAVLTWTAPSETDGKTYNVYRNFLLIASELTETTFIDSELDATVGNTWVVTVTCEDGGESEEAIVVKTGCINPYITPDTDTEYTFDDLVTYSSGTVIKAGDIYIMRHDVTISPTDALIVTEDITVKIATGKILTINGSRWEIDAPEQAIFTNYTEGEYYATIRVEEGSDVSLNNATFTYGSGIRVIDSDFIMDNCTMNNHMNSSQASSAISTTRGKIIVKNSTFMNNVYPAFSSGANMGCTFEIINCYLENNSTANTNRPQINLGPAQSGETTKIIGNTIIGNRSLTMVGAISTSSLLGVPTSSIIEGNTMIDNRYGITLTGAYITGTIKGNIMIDNNVETNPMNGGSGINITASGGNVHAIITQNVISGSHWGITLVGNTSTYANGPTANIGNISVPEDHPDFNIGQNIFFNNGNGGELYDLYNNNPHDVMAQNNKWGVPEQTEELIRTVIRDKTNDPRYGTVTFMPPMVDCTPVTNLQVAYNDDCEAVLTWTAPANGDGITYNVYRDGAIIESDLTATTYTDTTNDIFTGHTWAVTVDCGGLSGESVQVEVTADPCAYIITATAGANGTINPSGEVIVHHGADKTFAISSAACYEISQVLVDGTDNAEAVASGTYTFTNVTANHTIEAFFAIKVFTITVSAGTGGGVAGGGTFNCGTSVTVTATANTGYEFVNWTEAGVQVSTTENYTFTVENNRNLVANFRDKVIDPTYTVTVIATEGGSVEIVGYEDLSVVFEQGESVTVKATIENENWQFNCWKDETGAEVSNNAEYIFNVLKDITLTAYFGEVGIRGNSLSGIVLYPNPFTNEINISNHVAVKSVQITNAAGQKVKQVTFDGKTILTGELASGVYFVVIESIAGNKAVYKMVKK